MGLIVGILIGVFCRRFLTAFFWCLGLSLLALALLGIGAANDVGAPIGGKIAILAIGFVTAMVFLNAGAMGVIAIKRALAKRRAVEAPKADVFGPTPTVAPAPPLNGGA